MAERLPAESGNSLGGINGKAERFIQTMLREWANGRRYGSPTERAGHLAGWSRYNYRRKHGSLGHRPLAASLDELLGNNLG